MLGLLRALVLPVVRLDVSFEGMEMAEATRAKLAESSTKQPLRARRTCSAPSQPAFSWSTPGERKYTADSEPLSLVPPNDSKGSLHENPAVAGVREPRNGLIMMSSDALSPLAELPPQPPRIAIKSKGKILLLNPADILSVEAEGNYVSLSHRTGAHLLRESISAMAEKLKLYGFVRIHRSVLVNASHVEEIYPGATGEYVLRLTGGKQFVVSRTYRRNLRALAQSWIGLGSFVDD